MLNVDKILEEGPISHATSRLLAFRLSVMGIVGFLIYGEYPFVSFLMIALAAFALIAWKRFKGTLPWCHIVASSIWAGIASGLFMKNEWTFALVFVALVIIETLVASKQVRAHTCS